MKTINAFEAFAAFATFATFAAFDNTGGIKSPDQPQVDMTINPVIDV